MSLMTIAALIIIIAGTVLLLIACGISLYLDFCSDNQKSRRRNNTVPAHSDLFTITIEPRFPAIPRPCTVCPLHGRRLLPHFENMRKARDCDNQRDIPIYENLKAMPIYENLRVYENLGDEPIYEDLRETQV